MATQAQIAAYKKASKAQNMTGMLSAAGGDMAKLKGLHKAAFPSGSSLPKAKIAQAPRPSASYRTPTTKKTGSSVAQAPKPTTSGTRATGGPKPSARGVTTTGGPRATASYRGPITQGRGRLATVGIKGASKATGSLRGKSLVKQVSGAHSKGSEAFKSAGTGSLKGKSVGRQIIGGLSKAEKSYKSAIARSDKAIISGIKKLKPKKTTTGFNRRQGPSR